VGVEVPVDVESLGTSRCIGGARPLDAAAAAEEVVGDAGVVARPAGGTGLPGLERGFGVVPLDQRRAVAVAEVHAPGVLEEDVEVAARFAWRRDGYLREVHGAVGIREGAQL